MLTTITEQDSALVIEGDTIQGASEVTTAEANDVGEETSEEKSLEILEAKYGTPDRYLDVTETLREAMTDGRLQITAARDVFGRDPVRGASKRLWVEYACGNERYAVKVREGRLLEIRPDGVRGIESLTFLGARPEPKSNDESAGE